MSTPQSLFPLLWGLLQYRELPYKPTYTVTETAAIFGVSGRTIRKMIASGKLIARDLPGRARFLAQDLEDFLRNSRRDNPADSNDKPGNDRKGER